MLYYLFIFIVKPSSRGHQSNLNRIYEREK